MKWARRMLIGSGLALASLAMASGAAGAADCGSMSGVGCNVTPTVAGTSGTPSIAGTAGTVAEPATVSATPASTSTGSSSLPFTGADIEEMAVVGVGAVLAGGLLLRRRRRTVDAEIS